MTSFHMTAAAGQQDGNKELTCFLSFADMADEDKGALNGEQPMQSLKDNLPEAGAASPAIASAVAAEGAAAPGSPRPATGKGGPLLEQFRAFAKFGDSKADGKAISLSQSDKWMKQVRMTLTMEIDFSVESSFLLNRRKSSTARKSPPQTREFTLRNSSTAFRNLFLLKDKKNIKARR